MGEREIWKGGELMIIQGSNNPIVIVFDAAVDEMPQIVVTLWGGRNSQPLKVWTLEDMTVTVDTAICPITEDETKNLPGTGVTLEVKGLDGDGGTVFWDAARLDTLQRNDRYIRLTRS